MSQARYHTQDVQPVPAGWRVRSVESGAHVIRVAFPPGPRRQGAGRVVQILHPLRSDNPCSINPPELVILGNPARPKGRRNPEEGTEQAIESFREFHGRDPKEIVEMQRSAAMRMDYFAIGPLLGLAPYVEGLKIPSPEHWDDGGYPVLLFKNVKLAMNPEGTQLYALGGDQDLGGTLGHFDADATKDFIDLCEIAYVTYEARKSLDQFDLVQYTHSFSEPRPLLGFDQVKREIFFVGGRYKATPLGIED